jgi:hypothetical protein
VIGRLALKAGFQDGFPRETNHADSGAVQPIPAVASQRDSAPWATRKATSETFVDSTAPGAC